MHCNWHARKSGFQMEVWGACSAPSSCLHVVEREVERTAPAMACGKRVSSSSCGDKQGNGILITHIFTPQPDYLVEVHEFTYLGNVLYRTNAIRLMTATTGPKDLARVINVAPSSSERML